MRLISPITGPAHHTAATRGLSNADWRSNGSPPRATTRATPTAMWVSGPASEIASVHGREQRLFGVVGGESGHELERDRRLGAGPPGDDGVGQFVDQRERGDRAGQPPAELAAVVEERQQHHEDDEPGADVHREAEQPEQRLGASGHGQRQRTRRHDRAGTRQVSERRRPDRAASRRRLPRSSCHTSTPSITSTAVLRWR